jgi:hypothetical protein
MSPVEAIDRAQKASFCKSVIARFARFSNNLGLRGDLWVRSEEIRISAHPVVGCEISNFVSVL